MGRKSTTTQAADVADVPWARSQLSPIEVIDRSELIERFGSRLWSRPEQLQFELVIHCLSGEGRHMVDFIDVALKPDHMVHVRPRQIHQWSTDGYEAKLILMRELGHQPADVWPTEPSSIKLTEDQQQKLELLYQLDQHHWTEPDGRPEHVLAAGALRNLFQATLEIPAGQSSDQGETSDAFFALRADIERHLDHQHSVQQRASRLGYSTKTLDRASRKATGKTAKALADERIALEARRLLALPGSQASTVARQLGFAEATNFSKFVKRVTGRLPSDWQQLGSIDRE